MGMTVELTAEEIVTNLLTSNEIINSKNKNFYITNPGVNLGDYLLSLPKDVVSEFPEEMEEPSKYAFIKGSWQV